MQSQVNAIDGHLRAEVVQRTERLAAFGDPNREAVLFALRKLTGQDVGKTTEAWRRLVIK